MDEVHTSLTFNRCLLTADQEIAHPYEIGGDSYGYFFYASQPSCGSIHTARASTTRALPTTT